MFSDTFLLHKTHTQLFTYTASKSWLQGPQSSAVLDCPGRRVKGSRSQWARRGAESSVTQQIICSPSVSGCYGGRVIGTTGGPEPLSRLGRGLPCVRTCLLLRDFPPVGHMAPMPQLPTRLPWEPTIITGTRMLQPRARGLMNFLSPPSLRWEGICTVSYGKLKGKGCLWMVLLWFVCVYSVHAETKQRRGSCLLSLSTLFP